MFAQLRAQSYSHTHAAPSDRPGPLVPLRIKYLVLNFPVKRGLNTLVVDFQ